MVSKWFQILFYFNFVFSSISFAGIVDMRNANFSQTIDFLKLPGTGYDLRVQLTYNSRTLHSGLFGFGWCSDFETTLQITAEGTIKLTECGGGQALIFSPTDFGNKKLLAGIDQIIKEVSKRNPKLNEKSLTELRRELRVDETLRASLAARLNITGKIVRGKTYLANSRANEKITFHGTHYERSLPDNTSEKYSKNGRLTHLYDRNGNYLRLNYSGSKLVSVSDNNGRKLSIKYNPITKKVLTVKGPNGIQTTFKTKGEDLVSAKDSKGDSIQFEYDQLHNLEKISFSDKSKILLKYDKDRDWVTSYTNRKGCVESYVYETNKETPQDHYWSQVTKKCKGKITNQSKFEFFHRNRSDGRGRFLYRTRSRINGSVEDITYHEVFGKPIRVVKNSQRTKYEYDSRGLLSVRNEDDRRMEFEYDPRCLKANRVKTTQFQKKKKSKKRSIASQLTTRFSYDQKKCNLTAVKASDGQRLRVGYDSRGRIALLEDQAKRVVKIKYDTRFGKPSVVTRPGLGSIQVSYNSSGAVKAVESQSGPKVASQVLGVFSNYLELIAPVSTDMSI